MKKIITTLLLIIISQLVLSKNIYVNKSNTAGNFDGTSWKNSYSSLLQAVDSANPADNIFISEGVYKAATGAGIFLILNQANIKLFGGCSATDTTLPRNPLLYKTILDGDIAGNDSASIFTDNVKRVIEIRAEGIVLEGLTIRGGYCNTPFSSFAGGSAIYKLSNVNFLSLINCEIIDNYGRDYASVFLPVISNSSLATMTIVRCTFARNESRNGGAIHIQGKATKLTNRIENCLFYENKAGDITSSGIAGRAGSSLYIFGEGATQTESLIINCSFTNNKDLGTASGFSSWSRTTVGLGEVAGGASHIARIYNCIFYNNKRDNNASAYSISRLHLQKPLTFVYNSTIQLDLANWTSGIAKVNCDSLNPQFVDPSTDFRLSSSSPAIDGGTISIYARDTFRDIASNPRIMGSSIDKGCYESSATIGINDFNNALSFLVFPNPTQNILTISSEEKILGIQIYSINGKFMHSSLDDSQVDVSSFKNGIYFIQITTKKGITIKRFIKS